MRVRRSLAELLLLADGPGGVAAGDDCTFGGTAGGEGAVTPAVRHHIRKDLKRSVGKDGRSSRRRRRRRRKGIELKTHSHADIPMRLIAELIVHRSAVLGLAFFWR